MPDRDRTGTWTDIVENIQKIHRWIQSIAWGVPLPSWVKFGGMIRIYMPDRDRAGTWTDIVKNIDRRYRRFQSIAWGVPSWVKFGGIIWI